MNPNNPALHHIAEIAKSLCVWDISKIVIEDQRFGIWSGSHDPKKHHYGLNGLVKHTLDVYRLSSIINAHYGNIVNEPILFLACLYHDYGKVWDYCWKYGADGDYSQENYVWSYTEHKHQIHHLSRSAIEWSLAVEKFPKYKPFADQVLHAILSHHGRREYRSPVEPQTKLAWILHLCDSMSARIDETQNIR